MNSLMSKKIQDSFTFSSKPQQTRWVHERHVAGLPCDETDDQQYRFHGNFLGDIDSDDVDTVNGKTTQASHRETQKAEVKNIRTLS